MSGWRLGRVEIPTPSTVAYRGYVHETLGGGLVLDVGSTTPEQPGQCPKGLSWHGLTEEEWHLLKQLCDQGADELVGPEGAWWVRPYTGRSVPESFPARQVMRLT
jgi:hypothetical protein